MWWDISAIVLAFVAVWLRWHDDPKDAALMAYLSVFCTQVRRRRTPHRRRPCKAAAAE